MSNLKLSPEQMVFMLKNHELIEYARIENIRGDGHMLDDFINSVEFQSLLGEMGWDDAIDRYEDMPEYDGTLRMQLIEQLNADVVSGKFVEPSSKGMVKTPKSSKPKVVRTEQDSDLSSLKRLKGTKFSFDDEE